MAEDVGSLVVRVAMDNSSFQKGVQNINRQLKVVQSEFKNATSSMANHGRGIDGLRAKQDMLGQSVELQAKLVEKYKNKLEQSKNTLRQTTQNQVELRTKVDNAKRAWEQSTQTLGQNAEETQQLRREYDRLSTEYTQNEERIRSNTRAIDNNTIRVNNAERRLNSLQSELIQTNTALATQTSRWTIFGNRINSIGQRMSTLGQKISNVGRNLTMSLSVPIALVGVGAVKSAIKFESSFAGVKKTVNGTAEELAQMETGIRKMAKTIPATTEEISHVAESAGQLGIEKDSILGFTRTIVDLGEATNLAGEEGASQLAKFANITSMSQKNFDRLGSTIVALGNNMATTEADIVAMGMRLAGAGHQVGMTESQIMSLASALSSVGIEAEAGGSAISKVMVNMQLAVEKGGDSLSSFAKVAGMSSKDFQKAFKQDASGALISFIKGLSQSEEKGISAIKVLDDMGISEVRMRDALLRAAGAGDLLNKSIYIGTQAWKENNALTKEAQQRYATTESKLKIIHNQIKDAGITIGKNLLPVIRDIAVKIAELSQKFAKLSPETQQTIIKLAGLTAVLPPLAWGLGQVINTGGLLFRGVGRLATGIGRMRGIMAGAELATGGLTGGVGALGLAAKAGSLLCGPLGLAIAGIGVAGVVTAKKLKEEVVPAVDLFANGVKKTTNQIKSANGTITTSYGEVAVKISDATKKAVGSYIELDKQTTKTLYKLYTDRTTMTKKNSQQLIGEYNKMNVQIQQGLDKQHKKRLTSLQKFFVNNKQMTDKEKAEILQKESQHNEQLKASEQEFQDKITSIIERATKENRELKDSEVKDIITLQNNMKQNAVKALSEQEIECKVIMERLKGHNDRLTAEMASEAIKNAEEQRKKSVAEAEKQYDEVVKNIIYLRDEAGKLTAEEADAMIKEAGRQRDQSIQEASIMKDGVVRQISDMNSDVLDDVDETDGHMIERWEKLGKFFTDNPIIRWIKTKIGGDERRTDKLDVYTPNNYDFQASKRLVDGYATGTNSATKGWHMVGEEGPELLWFGGGETVLNNKETMSLFNKGLDSKISYASSKAWGTGIGEGIAYGINTSKSVVSNALSSFSRTLQDKMKDIVSYSDPKKLSNDIMKDVVIEDSLHEANIQNVDEIEHNMSNMLNWGDKVKSNYTNFINFIDDMNEDEVNKSKELLDIDYKNRIESLNHQIRIASFSNKAKAEQLTKSKEALNNYYNVANELLDRHIEKVRTSIADEQRIYQDRTENMTKAISILSNVTGNLNKDIDNSRAKYELQSQKLELLTEQYHMLGKALGATAEETKTVRQELLSTQTAMTETQANIKTLLKQQYDEMYSHKEKLIQASIESNDKWREDSLKNINEVYTAKVKALDNELKWHDQAKTDEEDRDKEAELRKILSMNYSKKKKEETQKELDNLLKDRAERKYRESIEAQKDALTQELESNKNSIEQQYQDNVTIYNNNLAFVKDFYDKKKIEVDNSNDYEKLVVKSTQNSIIDMLKSYKTKYKDAGLSLGQGLVDGINSKLNSVTAKISSVSNMLNANRLPTLATVGAYGNETNTTNNSTTNVNNTYGSLLHTDNISINGYKDTEAFAEELEFYRQRAATAKGRW